MGCDEDGCRANLWPSADCSIQPDTDCGSDALFVQGFPRQVLCCSDGDKHSLSRDSCGQKPIGPPGAGLPPLNLKAATRKSLAPAGATASSAAFTPDSQPFQ